MIIVFVFYSINDTDVADLQLNTCHFLSPVVVLIHPSKTLPLFPHGVSTLVSFIVICHRTGCKH